MGTHDRRDVGAGLREIATFVAFARDSRTVYHTYTVSAPDPFVSAYHGFLLEAGAPKPSTGNERRKDEYPEAQQ